MNVGELLDELHKYNSDLIIEGYTSVPTVCGVYLKPENTTIGEMIKDIKRLIGLKDYIITKESNVFVKLDNYEPFTKLLFDLMIGKMSIIIKYESRDLDLSFDEHISIKRDAYNLIKEKVNELRISNERYNDKMKALLGKHKITSDKYNKIKEILEDE